MSIHYDSTVTSCTLVIHVNDDDDSDPSTERFFFPSSLTSSRLPAVNFFSGLGQCNQTRLVLVSLQQRPTPVSCTFQPCGFSKNDNFIGQTLFHNAMRLCKLSCVDEGNVWVGIECTNNARISGINKSTLVGNVIVDEFVMSTAV